MVPVLVVFAGGFIVSLLKTNCIFILMYILIVPLKLFLGLYRSSCGLLIQKRTKKYLIILSEGNCLRIVWIVYVMYNYVNAFENNDNILWT